MFSFTRSRKHRSRGATLVEAAFVTPIFFFCIFGIMEIGLAMSSVSTTSSSARDGARFASANFGVASNKQSVADQIRDVVQQDLGALTGFGTPQVLWIYKAASNGDPINGAGFSSCNTQCYRYTWNASSRTFVYESASPGWPTPDACITDGAIDTIGVFIQTEHRSVTSLMPNRTIREHVDIRLEPLPSNQCP